MREVTTEARDALRDAVAQLMNALFDMHSAFEDHGGAWEDRAETQGIDDESLASTLENISSVIDLLEASERGEDVDEEMSAVSQAAACVRAARDWAYDRYLPYTYGDPVRINSAVRRADEALELAERGVPVEQPQTMFPRAAYATSVRPSRFGSAGSAMQKILAARRKK